MLQKTLSGDDRNKHAGCSNTKRSRFSYPTDFFRFKTRPPSQWLFQHLLWFVYIPAPSFQISLQASIRAILLTATGQWSQRSLELLELQIKKYWSDHLQAFLISAPARKSQIHPCEVNLHLTYIYMNIMEWDIPHTKYYYILKSQTTKHTEVELTRDCRLHGNNQPKKISATSV